MYKQLPDQLRKVKWKIVTLEKARGDIIYRIDEDTEGLRYTIGYFTKQQWWNAHYICALHNQFLETCKA